MKKNTGNKKNSRNSKSSSKRPSQERRSPDREMKYSKLDEEIAALQLEGRNAVMEALNNETTIDKIFMKKGEIEGTLRVIAARAREKGRETTSAGMMGKQVDTHEPGMSQDLVISSENSMEN